MFAVHLVLATMHGPSEKATSARRRGRLIAAAALFVCICVWLGVRTELVAGRVLDARIEQYGLTAERAGLRPCGLLSVCMRSMQVHGVSRLDGPVDLQGVRITPALSRLFVTGGSPGTVSVDSVDVSIAVQEQNAGSTDHPSIHQDPDVGSDRWMGRLPALVVHGGNVSLSDPSGVYPALSVQLDRLEGRQSVDGYDVDGLVAVGRLGRALVHGELHAGGAPHVSLRMLEDNDVFELIDEAGPIAQQSTFSLGAIDVSWPPSVSVSPVSVRRLSMRLPGFSAWQLENMWAGNVRASLVPGGVMVEVSDLRVRLQGLLRASDVHVREARFVHDYTSGLSTWQMAIVDPAGSELLVSAGFQDAHMELAVSSDGINVSALSPLLTADRTGVISGGEFSGTLLGSWDQGRDTWEAQAEIAVDGVRVSAGWLAEEPVDLGRIGVLGNWRYERPAQEMVAQGIRVAHEDLQMELDLWSGNEEGLGRVRRLNARLGATTMRALLSSIPAPLRGVLEDVVVDGEFEASAELVLVMDAPQQSTLTADVELLQPLSLVRDGLGLGFANLSSPTGELLVTDEHGDRWLTGPGAEGWTPLGEMPTHAWRAIVAAEDDAFFQHHGFDVRGIEGAIRANLEAGHFVRGGSTISQQLIKNLYLTRDRSMGRKLQEVVLTALLEAALTKEQILEWYVNGISWGPGIHGIDEAARSFFGHGARSLTLRESSFLAAILPNPTVFGQQYRRGDLEEGRRVKMRNILLNLQRAGVIDQATFDAAAPEVLAGRVSASRPVPTPAVQGASQAVGVAP
jgi:hypothetical protein